MENVTNSAHPSIIILNGPDQDYVDKVNFMIAPLVMGTFTDMFLQGILVVQTTNYFAFREVDGPQHRFKWLVIILCALCGLKSVQNIVIVWNATIATYGNPAASSALISGSWVFYTTGLSTAIIATIAQTFFAHRYWKLTKRWYICIIMLLGMVISLFAAALVPVAASTADAVSASKWSLVHFVAAIVVDGLVTIGTAVYLHSRRPGVQSTSEIIDRLVRTTWQSALPPAVCVCINAVLTETHERDLLQIALNTVLPKLYAISLMYTLNTRNELRGSRGSEPSNGGQITLAAKHTSVAPSTDTFFRNATASVGAVTTGNDTRKEKRGTRVPGGHTMSFGRHLDATGGRVDGIHVETHVATDIDMGSRDTVEINSFQGNEDKNGRNSGDSDVWGSKIMINAVYTSSMAWAIGSGTFVSAKFH